MHDDQSAAPDKSGRILFHQMEHSLYKEISTSQKQE